MEHSLQGSWEMKIRYQFLSTGYHFVSAISYYHLFIQWQLSDELCLDNISHNGVSLETRQALLDEICKGLGK